jgi:hypothetical protein
LPSQRWCKPLPNCSRAPCAPPGLSSNVMSSHVRLVCLPTRDIAFSERVRSVLVAMPELDDPGDLQTALRPAYPGVLVRPSVLEGLRTPTWYVYRGGTFPWSDGAISSERPG